VWLSLICHALVFSALLTRAVEYTMSKRKLKRQLRLGQVVMLDAAGAI
jgi:hypothetical protein